MIANYIHFVFNKLRVNDAWRYKVPVLITVPYWVIYHYQTPFLPALFFIALSFTTIIGIAAYAYTLNDWSDIEKDAAAGKPNAMAALSNSNRVILLAAFFALAVTPWFFFPYTPLTIGLLILELVLFALYSFPPFRLKEKPILGILTDTSYAHVLPCLLAALTFQAIAHKYYHQKIDFFFLSFGTFLCFWQVSLGIRNILLHQQQDYYNDLQSATVTFATSYPKLANGTLKLMLVAEVIGFIALTDSLGKLMIGIGIAFALHLATVYVNNKQLHFGTLRQNAYILLDDFYYKWLALPVLVYLCISDIRFVVLLALHILLFDNAIKDAVKRIAKP